MKKIYIIGMGVSFSSITGAGIDALKKAEIITGSENAVGMLKDALFKLPKEIHNVYKPLDVLSLVKAAKASHIAVLVSGDAGFYSGAARLCEALADYDLEVVAGVSAVSVFFAKIKKPWQNAALISAHGKNIDVVSFVRRNRLTFCLTGNNVNTIGTELKRAGFGNIKAYVGENLGRDSEKVYEVWAEELEKGNFPPLTVLLFENDNFDDSIPSGIEDSEFERLSGVPMTKAEIRAVVLSKLKVKPSSICYDIGAGTGSVTVEMALAAYLGHVYAVEKKQEAIPLIFNNARKFHLGNVTVVCGQAPEAIACLPKPDVVFIGGSGGEMKGIIKAALSLNPYARIVITAVSIETVQEAVEGFKGLGIEPDIVTINVSKGKKAGRLHMMEAMNPVTVISAGGMA